MVSNRGVLQGDLILVASGDLTMGGRTNPDGTVAVSDLIIRKRIPSATPNSPDLIR
jgi:hypothetical protein